MITVTKSSDKKSQRGAALPIVIAVIALILLVSGVVYLSRESGTDRATGEVLGDDLSRAGSYCGDGICQEVVCMAIGCPTPETEENCPEDCAVPIRNPEANDGLQTRDPLPPPKFSGEILAGKSAYLLDFTKADYDNALQSDKLIVLYFYANWCPICKAEFPKVEDVFNSLETENVIGFRVNYNDSDTDTDEKNLAKQFGVAYQHTKVFVKSGERVLKSPEGWDSKKYLEEISKHL